MVGRCVGGSATRGRVGLTCETILRCAVIARLMNFSYRELEFALHDSKSTQRFARVDPLRVPKKSALDRHRDWERLDRVLLREAKERGSKRGRRCASTAPRPPPTSWHLRTAACGTTGAGADAVCCAQAQGLLPELQFSDHCRAAKRRERQVGSARRAQAATGG